MDSEWEKERGLNPSKKKKKKKRLLHKGLNAQMKTNKMFHRNKVHTFTLLQHCFEYASHEISLRKMAPAGLGYSVYEN
jgi:hypothetical protein